MDLFLPNMQHFNFIYIYAFSRCFYPKRLTVHSGYDIFYQYACSLGIEPTIFCGDNAMLYHWPTGTHCVLTLYKMLSDDWSRMDYLWIIVIFLSAVGLSFWRHPFTAEHPLESKWCLAKFLQICFDKETNTSWMAWRRVHFQQFFIFGWTIPLKYIYIFFILIILCLAFYARPRSFLFKVFRVHSISEHTETSWYELLSQGLVNE